MAPTKSPKSPKSPRTPRPQKGTPLSQNKVLSGRISKKASSPPEKQQLNISDSLLESERSLELEKHEEMMKEKELFPGSDDWADDEERLFQILFMRQYSPLLPSHWGIDFRGIPIPDILFATSHVNEPTIYSYSDQNFRATKALTRLIELTASVKGFMQTNQRRKIPHHIKKELDSYLVWAAKDGAYDKLDAVPNIFVELIDTSSSTSNNNIHTEIQQYMQTRMRDLAEEHREFWSPKDDEVSQVKVEPTDGDHVGATTNSGATEYVMRPPVLYGMFIIRHTVLLLTIDAAKGPNAHVSYQVEINFARINQGVWNAITVGIVTCLARDDMITRKEHFQTLPSDPDSDPDV